ncbi:hypothetical protein PHJA_000685700 [Phtheirospermum japonicum]|uniref:Uncharacterized protein n=1 Tax=Phtheirospermum japonicum TaxID=374723 RepID=A0A830BCU7_9LAMI|nr:hypothetical protein PHJA_000685700 [Phtheirospermum japonicum]
MEKQWVEDVIQSPQYQYGLIHPFIDQLWFEGRTDVDESEFYDSDDSLDTYRIPNPQETLNRFLKQVRESRGYDVDVMVPRRFGSYLCPIDLKMMECDSYRDVVMRGLNTAMENINAESEKETGKTYEFVEFKKIVEGYPFIYLLTFTARVRDTNVVKTLQAMVYAPHFEEPEFFEWRVKPDPSATEARLAFVDSLSLSVLRVLKRVPLKKRFGPRTELLYVEKDADQFYLPMNDNDQKWKIL